VKIFPFYKEKGCVLFINIMEIILITYEISVTTFLAYLVTFVKYVHDTRDVM